MATRNETSSFRSRKQVRAIQLCRMINEQSSTESSGVLRKIANLSQLRSSAMLCASSHPCDAPRPTNNVAALIAVHIMQEPVRSPRIPTLAKRIEFVAFQMTKLPEDIQA